MNTCNSDRRITKIVFQLEVISTRSTSPFSFRLVYEMLLGKTATCDRHFSLSQDLPVQDTPSYPLRIPCIHVLCRLPWPFEQNKGGLKKDNSTAFTAIHHSEYRETRN